MRRQSSFVSQAFSRSFLLSFGLLVVAAPCLTWGQDTAETPPATPQVSKADQLRDQQKLLADRYRLLEQKLFDLHEFEMY